MRPDITDIAALRLVTGKLPANPRLGQQVYFLADATNGVAWLLAYMPDGSAFPWKRVGGGDLFASVDSDPVTDTAFNGAFAAPAGGPTLTIPLAGEYLVTVGGNWAADVNSAIVYFSYAVGATPAADVDGVAGYSGAAGAAVRRDDRRTKRKTITVAGTVLTFNWSATGASRSYNRFLQAHPIRVAG